MLPVLLASHFDLKKIFDFGGNSGLIPAVMKNSLVLEHCMLIEENDTMLDFAKWRDAKLKIQGINYNKESDLVKEIEKHEGHFDLGICTEVLEHVYDVPETVQVIASLICKGGFLYQSTSFGLYPEPSHLKKNLVYAGHEDELMAQYGFEPVSIQFPIPMLGNLKIYRKRRLNVNEPRQKQSCI